MKFKKLHWIAITEIFLGIALYYIGNWWTDYTIAHSSNPRIDFNFSAAFMMLAGMALVPVGIVTFVVAYFKQDKKSVE